VRIAEQLAHYADQGITEIIYQPAGPDITRELERFITVAQQTKQTVPS
jgi:5,10-methylenetetrahydromethanopterin reductase